MPRFHDDAMNLGYDFGIVDQFLEGCPEHVQEAFDRIMERFNADDAGEPENTCEVCGCTDSDCSECLALTGEACHWANEEKTLCSRCADDQAVMNANRAHLRNAGGRKKKKAELDPAIIEHPDTFKDTAAGIEASLQEELERDDDMLHVSVVGIDGGQDDEEEETDEIQQRAAEVSAEQRRMRRWLPAEDALITGYIKSNQTPEFIMGELNRETPENPRTIGAVKQRIFKLKAGM